MMQLRAFQLSIVFALSVLVLADSATAWPRRRPFQSLRERGLFSNTSRSSGGVRMAPKSDTDSAGIRVLNLDYCYDTASDPQWAFGDRLRVFLRGRDERVVQADRPLVAQVKITDLSHVNGTQIKTVPVSLLDPSATNGLLGMLDIADQNGESPLIRPGKVYRLFVNLHLESEQYDDESVLGRISLPYYVATGGESRLERGRQRVVMRAFREFYYRQRGWRSNARYRMDCVEFYRWAAAASTVDSQSGLASLARLFGAITPFRNGGLIPLRARESGIHGDYVRVPGHSFMLLAHDEELNQTWTIEGNFNRTVEVGIRSANSSWSYGPLEEEHICEELVGPPETQASSNEPVEESEAGARDASTS